MRPATGLLSLSRRAVSTLAVSALAGSALAASALAAPAAPAPGPTPPRPDPAAISERAALLAPIQVESLTLTPIVAIAAAAPATKDPEMLVLDEAMASKQVKIS